MKDTNSHEARLIELESRVMHQDRMIEELNAVVVGQAQALDRLERQLAKLIEEGQTGSSQNAHEDAE